MLDDDLTRGLDATAELDVKTDDIPPQDDDASNDEPQNNDDNQQKIDNQNQKVEGAESDIYGAPETFDYSQIQMPEGMKLDEDMVGEFNAVAKKFNLSNSSANELMNLAVKLTEKNAQGFKDLATQLQEAERNSYLQMLNDDKELDATNEEKYNPYLAVANEGVKAVATQGFIDFIKSKGLCHHPEFIKTFHKIGLLCKDDNLPNGNNPVGTVERPADVLYGDHKSAE